MTEQKNIIIFPEKAELEFKRIINTYGLEESDAEAFNILMGGKLFKVAIIKKIIRAFVANIISEKDFNESLHKIIKDQETAQKVSQDIIANLVPLLDKVPEDQLEQYNLQKDKEDEERLSKINTEKEAETVKEDVQKLMLEKIRQNAPIEKPLAIEPQKPDIKKVDIVDVDKNAEELVKARELLKQKEEELTKAKTVLNQEEQKRGPDAYREQIE